MWVVRYTIQKREFTAFCCFQPFAATDNQMAKAKKSTSTSGATSRRRRLHRSWSVYIFRTLKQVHKQMGISSKGMAVVNSFCTDIFERVAEEAANLVRLNKTKTLGSREIQTAVRLVLPAELAKHSMAEGTKAVAKFTQKA